MNQTLKGYLLSALWATLTTVGGAALQQLTAGELDLSVLGYLAITSFIAFVKQSPVPVLATVPAKRGLGLALFLSLLGMTAAAQEDDFEAYIRTHPATFQGGILPNSFTIVDRNVLSSEMLNETNFATHAKWDATGDFVDTGGNCTYTHSTGAGTCLQTSANQLVRGAPGTAADPRWYKFVYTTTLPSGAAPTCTLTTGYALTAQTLPVTAGQHAITFRGALVPGSLVISCVSTAAGIVTFDDVSLKRVVGGAPIAAGTMRAEDIQVGAPFYPGTMTYETSGLARTRIDSFTWTNAMVVALGASTTGDILVARIPPKTAVLDAKVVILTPDTSSNALTVSCGVSATTYLDWIVNSDAKASANTVYGDAAAERGTALDIEYYALPSYTAESAVYCHFIKTTSNLDTVTGSTGRVILTTMLLP